MYRSTTQLDKVPPCVPIIVSEIKTQWYRSHGCMLTNRSTKTVYVREKKSSDFPAGDNPCPSQCQAPITLHAPPTFTVYSPRPPSPPNNISGAAHAMVPTLVVSPSSPFFSPSPAAESLLFPALVPLAGVVAVPGPQELLPHRLAPLNPQLSPLFLPPTRFLRPAVVPLPRPSPPPVGPSSMLP